MADEEYTPHIFDTPVHVVPLGHVDIDEDGPLLTLGDYPGGNVRGIRLTPEQHELIDAQDPATNAQELPTEAKAKLWWMGNRGMLALVPDGVRASTLTLIPVVRKPLTIDGETEDGYLIGTGDGGGFTVSDLASEFIFHIDGHRTLAEIAKLVRADVLANDAWRAALERRQVDEDKDLDSLLSDAALAILLAMQPTGAATFDRAA